MAAYAYEKNNSSSKFLARDVAKLTPSEVKKHLQAGKYTLLAGCAPCQPFSKLTNGKSEHAAWDLLDYFGLLVKRLRPDLVTMENVPELAGRGLPVFSRFLSALDRLNYHVDWKVVNCQDYGVPQTRTRLVLLASKLGKVTVPKGRYSSPRKQKTVRQAIGRLSSLTSGQRDERDPIHVASKLSPMNELRMSHTPTDGGSWKSWPEHLVLDCHKKSTGKKYVSIYGRMWWDRPAPTMTTLCTGIGNGRFGHPVQNRAITLREAALLQSFPKNYDFWPTSEELNRSAVSRHIGNAVPPALAKALGKALIEHVEQYDSRQADG